MLKDSFKIFPILFLGLISTSFAAVNVTEDVNVMLTGFSEGDLQITTGSQADSITVGGVTLTVTDIPIANVFNLKTPAHNKALELAPAGGVVDLTLVTSDITSDHILRWTLNTAGTTSVGHIVGTEKASTLYSVKVDGVEYSQHTSSAGKEVSFSYTAGGDNKVFTLNEVGGPAISAITSTDDGSGGIDVEWSTDVESSSQIEYGTTDAYGTLTTETDTGVSRTQTHTVNIPDLAICTLYHYRVKSTNELGEQSVSADQTVITNGCLTDASVTNAVTQEITDTGGTLTAIDHVITVPAGLGTNTFQILKLDDVSVLATTGTPLLGAAAGSNIYEYNILSAVNTKVTTVPSPVTISLNYSDADAIGVIESSLRLYRWDNGSSSWVKLDNGSVDVSSNTVTGQSTHFSTFGLFGAPIAITPTSSSGGGGGGRSYHSPVIGSNSSDLSSLSQSATKGESLTNISCRFTDNSLYEKGGLSLNTAWMKINGKAVAFDSEIIEYTNPPSEFSKIQPKIVDIFYIEELVDSEFAEITDLEVSCGMQDYLGGWSTTEFIYKNRNILAIERMNKKVEECRSKIFTDVPEDHWSRYYVDYVYCADVMHGYANSRLFGANNPTTRAELMKASLLASSEIIPEIEHAPYIDVPAFAWYAPYIEKAKNIGLIDAIFHKEDNNKFYPNRPITRGEAMQTLAILGEVKLEELVERTYRDVAVHRPYASEIDWATQEGIVSGYEPTSSGDVYFGPYDILTREQLAKIIVRFMNYLGYAE